jgi:hypothetical protein
MLAYEVELVKPREVGVDSLRSPSFFYGRQGYFFGFALYLDLSRDARPLPRGLTGHVAHPKRSILPYYSFSFARAAR